MRGDGPEVPGPRTLLYPRARRMRDIIDHHSRSAAGVSLSTSTRSDTTKSRYWVTTIRLPVVETTPTDPSPQPPAEGCSAAATRRQPWNRVPQPVVAAVAQHVAVCVLEGVSGGNTPKPAVRTLTTITQRPRSRLGAGRTPPRPRRPDRSGFHVSAGAACERATSLGGPSPTADGQLRRRIRGQPTRRRRRPRRGL